MSRLGCCWPAPLVLAVLGGCEGAVPGTNYGDGRVVEVQTDPAFTADELEAIRIGAHVWDALGVQFRLTDEVPIWPVSASVYVVRSPFTYGFDGMTWPWLNRVDVYANEIDNFYSGAHGAVAHDIAVTVAHELGHEMGLWHAGSDAVDVMAAASYSLTLGPEDVASFKARYGR